MTTDFRALCAELIAAIEKGASPSGYYGTVYDPEQAKLDELLTRARAALAEYEPTVPKNCWLDDEPYLCPSSCVFDDPNDDVCNCTFATKLQAGSKPKTDCEYYRQ